MFPTYHSAKEKKFVSKTPPDATNIDPIDVMATFNPEGKFRIDYMRIVLSNEERLTVKLLTLKREVVNSFWIQQEYNYVRDKKLCTVTIVYNIAEHRFYVKRTY